MSVPYRWRKLDEEAREKLLKWRKQQNHPWHRPPHREGYGDACYHITAACFEHKPHVGRSIERMQSFSDMLLAVLSEHGAQIHAWCVLPNHYHLLVQTERVLDLLFDLGRLNGRTSRLWNVEDRMPGRKTWCGVVDHTMRGDGHFWATLNYVHHNPVRHGYTQKWQEWPFSSAQTFVEEVGREEVLRLWKQFPLRNYGAGWDEPSM